MKSKLDKIIELIRKAEEMWPDNLMLFANNGSLLLVETSTNLIITEFPSISCDGGDAGTYYDDNGNEYLSIDKL